MRPSTVSSSSLAKAASFMHMIRETFASEPGSVKGKNKPDIPTVKIRRRRRQHRLHKIYREKLQVISQRCFCVMHFNCSHSSDDIEV